MRMGMLMALVALGVLAAEAPVEDAARQDLEKLQGDWQCTAMTVDGMQLPDDDVQALFRTIKGNQYTVTRYEKGIGKGTLKLDTSKSPHTIDSTPAGAAGKGGPILGIYEISGQTLKLCLARPGQERPKDFTSKPGSGYILSVWTRERH